MPIGLPVPPGALGPAGGTVVNDGDVTTAGARSDAVHVFADGAFVTNTGALTAAGDAASGMNAKGAAIHITNAGSIIAGVSTGRDAAGIRLTEASGVTVANTGNIDVEGRSAGGVAGTTLLVAAARNTGTIAADGTDAFGVDLSGRDVRVDNGSDAATGAITARGERATAIRGRGEHIENVAGRTPWGST